MTHIMIDLETLSVQQTAVIVEFGFAIFDIDGNGVWLSGSLRPSIEEQLKKFQRDISFDTIAWWLKQSDDARLKLADTRQTISLDEFFQHIEAIDWKNFEGVWSHGAIFDLAIVQNLYEQRAMPPLWAHKTVRDTRTLLWLFPVELVRATVAHSAEADAIAQALTMQRAYAAYLEARHEPNDEANPRGL